MSIGSKILMAEELEVLWKKLSFTEEEGVGVDLGNNSTKVAKEIGINCAIMKVLSQKSINFEALRKNLRMLWKTNKWVHFSELEAELVLVEFGDVKDKRKILDMSPWNFEKQLVIIQDFEGELTPMEMELKWSPFWIQIFNLPLMSRTKETGWAIGSSIGEVMEVDVPDSGVVWGKSLRVRVRIDATKRLIRGKKITIEGGAARWVQFKYERLPNFCYHCGLLSHALRDCPEPSETGRLSGVGLQYGAWLRGDPFGRVQKDPGRFGGGENRDTREDGTENRPVQPNVQADVPGDHARGTANPVMGSVTLASCSLAGCDAFREAPIQLSVNPREGGMGDGAGGKGDEATSTKSVNVSSTPCSQSDASEESRRMTRQDQFLGKTPCEVSPLSTCSHPFPAVLSEAIVSEEDIPPGFEGQPRRAGGASLDQGFMGGPLVGCEQMGFFSSGPVSAPSIISDGPSFESTRAAPSPASFLLGRTSDSSVHTTSLIPPGPLSPNSSDTNISMHVVLKSGPKWSRILRSSQGSNESLLSPACRKRFFGEDTVQFELPNKKPRVFQVEIDNSVDMAEAGSQPCQGL